jgi:hypothetical protein
VGGGVRDRQPGGKPQAGHVDAATSFVNSSTQAHAKFKDISVGDQVAIKVVVKSGVDTAEQVKFVQALGSGK